MRISKNFVWLIALAVLAMAVAPAQAQFIKGSPAPDINAVDVNGKPVNMNKIISEGRDLVILFFFSVQTGEDLGVKLTYLHTRFGGRELEIIALGLREDEEALRKFARDFQISYYIIDANSLENAPWLKNVDVLPLTLFVMTADRTIEKVLRGGSKTKAQILKEAAETFFQRRQLEQAAAITEDALKAGEDPKDVGELRGFVLVAEGKLDEAEKEFGEIDSKTGLAKVALERGDFTRAMELAGGVPENAYADSIKAQALIHTGKLGEAAEVLDATTAKPAADWQRSEIANTQGRIAQHQGDADVAVAHYREAVALDPYNIVALSNEGAVHRKKGKLEEAQKVLEKASRIRPDDMSAIMLQQVQRELKEANDVKRHDLIRKQIADLSKRYEEMKEAGADKSADEWSTRPIILALLPSRQPPVFFERAGTDVVLQREIEARLQRDEGISVVERQMLDQLLEELNLGSSELASADTQRRLGQVLSAGLLGFMDFAELGADIVLYLRLVDTETTAITMQISESIDENHPSKTIDTVVAKILDSVAGKRELKGLIADASSDEAVMINLGAKHGVEAGQQFNVLQNGAPIEVGGRVIAHRQRAVAKLEVTTVEDQYAICKVTHKAEGVELAKEMKISATK